MLGTRQGGTVAGRSNVDEFAERQEIKPDCRIARPLLGIYIRFNRLTCAKLKVTRFSPIFSFANAAHIRA